LLEEGSVAELPALLLIGTHHLANPNRDHFNVQVDDVLLPRRQAEIRHCVDRLKRFQPSKVAVEIPRARDGALNQAYRAYRAGTAALERSEVQQLGFRLADELGHDRIHAIDWFGGRDVDPIAFAREHGQGEIVDEILTFFGQQTEELNAVLPTMSIAELLRLINDEARLRREHEMYLRFARIGVGDRYAGADWLAGWYERNLKIFANLVRITMARDERILVIYGVGHVPLLSRFIRDSGRYTLERSEAYLAE
jgi:hypothetical protein